MSNSGQFTVYLSERQRFYLYSFVASAPGAQPKSRADMRLIQGVFETFGLDKILEKLENLPAGSQVLATDFDNKLQPISSGSVDLNTLLGYVDGPGATATGALKLLAISDELQRAKEGKTRLESVPEGEVKP